MGRKFGWHSGKLTCKELEVQNVMKLGTLDFGAAELDSILIKGRISTSTLAGAALSLGSGYTYGELMEMRATVTSWSGIAGSFKGYYFRAETTVGNASYGIRGMEIFSVANITSGTTGLTNVDGLYVEQALKHGAASWTISGYSSAIEANISIYAGAGTLTITNYLTALRAKIQGASGLADYTKVHGIVIECRDADSSTRKFGSAITIQNPADAFVSSWTTGIDITAACTRGIRIGTHDWGEGITGLAIGASDPLFQIGGKVTTANADAGVYASSYSQLALIASQNKDVSMAASWNELYITGGTINLTGSSHYYSVWGHVEVVGAVTSSTGDLLALKGSFIIPAGFINNGVIAGCKVDAILHTSMTNSGRISAFEIGDHNDPYQGDWDYGLYIPDATVTTGISIGTTTGAAIHFGAGTATSTDGDLWYDAASKVFKYYNGTTTKTIQTD